jgi:hypothetical protein
VEDFYIKMHYAVLCITVYVNLLDLTEEMR